MRAIFFGEQNVQWSCPRCLLFKNTRKKRKVKSRTRSRSRPRISRSLILHKAGHITKVSIIQCERTPKLVILVDCYRTTLSKDSPPWQGCSLSKPISNWPFRSWTVFFISILQVLFLLSFPPCNGSKSSPVQSNTRVWYVVELIHNTDSSPFLHLKGKRLASN